jgi:glyoxylase-like metal-dependent hydrolase (beta-lactamase superfamily II)
VTRPGWHEAAAGVYVWRQPRLDVNAVLVVGDEGALLVDTLSTAAEAAELAAAARRVTRLPWQLANTHAHFDHWFGNATLAAANSAGTTIWAQERCRDLLAEGAGRAPAEAAAAYRDADPGFAAELAAVVPREPGAAVHEWAEVDLGGRVVELRFLGRGHTDHDLVAVVTDAGIVCAGDLVEEGAPPSFDDAYPLEWPATLAALLELASGPVVPGHGAVVDAAFVRGQHAALADLEWHCREGHLDRAPVEEVAAHSPFGPASVTAVRRAYAQLDGRL